MQNIFIIQCTQYVQEIKNTLYPNLMCFGLLLHVTKAMFIYNIEVWI